jgi:hypothetical protein
VVELLLCKCEALSSNVGCTKKKPKNKKNRKKQNPTTKKPQKTAEKFPYDFLIRNIMRAEELEMEPSGRALA